MIKKMTMVAAAAALAVTAMSHNVMATTAQVNLSSFLQDMNVSNDPGSTSDIVEVTYSLGTPGDGIATWDTTGNDGDAGGTASGFLSDPTYFQTVSFSGLSIAPGSSSDFGTLDIDRIVTLDPLLVMQDLDETGSSLVNAFIGILWADGSFGQTGLEQTAWRIDQNLTVGAELSPIPVPAALPLFLSALGAVGFVGWRRKQAFTTAA